MVFRWRSKGYQFVIRNSDLCQAYLGSNMVSVSEELFSIASVIKEIISDMVLLNWSKCKSSKLFIN
jgi:hypothetical protein